MTSEKPSEFTLIEMIKESFSEIPNRGLEGIGDDCAVIPLRRESSKSGESIVVTTDMLVEDIHFRRSTTSAYMLGRKSLAVNLSDVAAMGAEPICSLLAISLPEDVDSSWITEFMDGYRSLSSEFGVPLIGGDTTASKDRLTISVTAMGRARNGNIKRRSAAKVGDILFVTGYLGASAQGLEQINSMQVANKIQAGRQQAELPEPKQSGLDREIGLHGQCGQTENSFTIMAHNNPKPYIKEGAWLGGVAAVHAMMDLSDGIASDLQHILKASSVSAKVEINNIPTNTDIEKALCGGEDYVLLLSVAPNEAANVASQYRSEFGEELHEIGVITEGEAEIQWLKNGLKIESDWHGFSHF